MIGAPSIQQLRDKCSLDRGRELKPLERRQPPQRFAASIPYKDEHHEACPHDDLP
jgi:hypothetical protein